MEDLINVLLEEQKTPMNTPLSLVEMLYLHMNQSTAVYNILYVK